VSCRGHKKIMVVFLLLCLMLSLIWVHFYSFSLQHIFVNPNQVIITFGYVCLATLMISFLVLFLWEYPRYMKRNYPV